MAARGNEDPAGWEPTVGTTHYAHVDNQLLLEAAADADCSAGVCAVDDPLCAPRPG